MRSANLGFLLEGAPSIVTLASKVGGQTLMTKDTVLCERMFVNQGKVSDFRWEEVEREGIQESRRAVSNPAGGSGNVRPKAPQPDGGTPQYRMTKECNREQKKDAELLWQDGTNQHFRFAH